MLQPREVRLPLPLVRVMELAGIVQGWRMFGEDPGGVDYSWNAPGELVDGRRVDDLLPQTAPELLTRVSHVTYARWLKLREAMWRPEPRTLVAQYLCRRHDADARVPLRWLDLFATVRYLAPNGVTKTEHAVRLLHQECAASRADARGGR
jgi:hypothetical protein